MHISDDSISKEVSQLENAVLDSLSKAAREVIPKFLKNMPHGYFKDTDHATRLSHINAIISATTSHSPLAVTLRSENDNVWTFIHATNRTGLLAELVRQLPKDKVLQSAKIHTALDGSLVIDTFRFEENESGPRSPESLQNKVDEILQFAENEGLADAAHSIRNHIQRCSPHYVLTVSCRRFLQHWNLVRKVRTTDNTQVFLEAEEDFSGAKSGEAIDRISIAVRVSDKRLLFEQLAYRLSTGGFDILQAYTNVFPSPNETLSPISILSFIVRGQSGEALGLWTARYHSLIQDLYRLTQVDRRVVQIVSEDPSWPLSRAELLVCLVDLVHQKLARINEYAFTRGRILRLARKNGDLTRAVLNMFTVRFHPESPLSDTEHFLSQLEKIQLAVNQSVETEDEKLILRNMLGAIASTLRTNFFFSKRQALALRMEPDYLEREPTNPQADRAFGLFFIHGKHFNGFHVRFSDIARGGLRVVLPRGPDQHAIESERHFDEAYGLAAAQHLKNKDIPEGGSKGVIVVEPKINHVPAVMAFGDALLDLIAPVPEEEPHLVDYYGQPELIYLGPDENMNNFLIEWLVNRAIKRGYPVANAFMSSKPGAGINHKEYGVTSEGVIVFLETLLQHNGLNPRETPFTLKMTGGPDGDVGGNAIRILFREFGDNVKILGIADGTGVAEDPSGLSRQELLRLVETGLPISHFNKNQLSEEGQVVSADTPEGLKLRGSLHNRLVTDAFLPCGGRPATINAVNWRDFLQADGTPSCPMIVEGANLFITEEARSLLSKEAGVQIIKDSSANKAGVICSSFEIAAAMLLDEVEFLQIKNEFVEEVLVKLRSLAKREALLLLRENQSHPGEILPETSIRVSRAINRTSEIILHQLDSFSKEDLSLVQLAVREHLPDSLIKTSGEDRIHALPPSYLNRIIAKTLSARINYREGIAFLEEVPAKDLGALALNYLQQAQETKRIIAAVEKSRLADKNRIIEILRHGGIRAGLEIDREAGN